MIKLNQVLYFIIAVIIFSSIGVWLPLLIDFFNYNSVSDKTIVIIPNSIISYSLSIFTIGLIDRILFMVDMQMYRHKKLEILVSVIVIILVSIFVFETFRALKNNLVDNAIIYSVIASLISYITWWIANYKGTKVNPVDSLGGEV